MRSTCPARSVLQLTINLQMISCICTLPPFSLCIRGLYRTCCFRLKGRCLETLCCVAKWLKKNPDSTVLQVRGDVDFLRAIAAGSGAEERQSPQNPAVLSEPDQDIRYISGSLLLHNHGATVDPTNVINDGPNS